MRLLVTGSRKWLREDKIHLALEEFDVFPEITLVVGDCPTGADLYAREIGSWLHWNVEVHYARWQEYGKAAGPIRNQEMVDSGADQCFAFLVPGQANVGTRGCMAKAEKAGIPVHEFWE